MNVSRNLIQGVAGGVLGASVLGLVEAFYLLGTQGAPDLLSPFYAFVLYGLLGLPFGLGAGLVLTVIERFYAIGDDIEGDSVAFAFGAVGSVSPLLLFILFYLGNKVVYAEQGVPLTGLLAIAAIVGVYAIVEMTAGVWLYRGPLSFLLRGPGVLGLWAGVAAVLGALSFVQVTEDPRDAFASGKPILPTMAERPNVLVLTIDTLRADYLGAYGKEGDPSPTLDAIGADGLVFEKAFAQASWTRSSFASLWTSRLPSSHNAATKAARLPDDVDLLSEVLQAAGVTTGNLANNINVTSTFNFDQGWDSYVYESPAYSFGATESVFSLTFYKVVHKVNEKLGGAKHVESFYQPAEVVLADAQRFIDANASSRWMLGVHLMEPHDPYFEHPYLDGSGDAEFNGVGFARAEVEHPDPADADYLKQVYLDEIRHMDRKLAEFVGWLKEKDLYDDLMIVITADHGEEFGEHGGFWHGTTLYEEQVHVPLIVKLPANELAGTRLPFQVRSIDVAPTIAAALGVEPSPQWEGSDLLAEIREAVKNAEAEEAAAQAEKDAALAELSELEGRGEPTEEQVARMAEIKAMIAAPEAVEDDPCAAYALPHSREVVSEQDFEGNVIEAFRKGGFKYIRANEGNPRGLPTEALFDVVKDPGETANLVGESGQRCGNYVSDLPTELGEELSLLIKAAAANAKDGGSAEMSEAEIQKLCALGYMSGPACGE